MVLYQFFLKYTIRSIKVKYIKTSIFSWKKTRLSFSCNVVWSYRWNWTHNYSIYPSLLWPIVEHLMQELYTLNLTTLQFCMIIFFLLMTDLSLTMILFFVSFFFLNWMHIILFCRCEDIMKWSSLFERPIIQLKAIFYWDVLIIIRINLSNLLNPSVTHTHAHWFTAPPEAPCERRSHRRRRRLLAGGGKLKHELCLNMSEIHLLLFSGL